jgi:hypothetical protein
VPRLPLTLPTLSIALLLAVGGRAALWADAPRFSPEDNAWARFDVGAWKKLRVVTEVLDDQGQVTSTSTTDTISRLEDVTDENYRLQIEVAVEVAGRKFGVEPRHVTRGFLGETAEKTSVFKNSSITTITIEGKDIPCDVYTVQATEGNEKRVIKVYYAPQFAPSVLRKETTVTDASDSSLIEEVVETVVAVRMPYKVLGEVMGTWHVKTVRTHPKGKTITLSIHSGDVPGGIVAHSSKEIDADGRLIRRSTLEVVDYGLESDRRIFPRFRPFKRDGRRR